MSGAQELFEQMPLNPKGDWSINDIQMVCRDNNLTCEPPSGGGSNWKISSPELDDILTVPARRPIKPIYFKVFVGLVRKSLGA